MYAHYCVIKTVRGKRMYFNRKNFLRDISLIDFISTIISLHYFRENMYIFLTLFTANANFKQYTYMKNKRDSRINTLRKNNYVIFH